MSCEFAVENWGNVSPNRMIALCETRLHGSWLSPPERSIACCVVLLAVFLSCMREACTLRFFVSVYQNGQCVWSRREGGRGGGRGGGDRVSEGRSVSSVLLPIEFAVKNKCKRSKRYSFLTHTHTHTQVLCEAQALTNFSGEESRDLSFKEGEHLRIISVSVGDGWLEAENALGERGLVPGNFVKVREGR